MLWLAIALIIAIPAWLGLSRRGSDLAPRRFVGRCLLHGAVAGVLVSGGLWLASPDVPTGRNLLYGPLGGAAAGGALGLLVGVPWMLIARATRGKHAPPVA